MSTLATFNANNFFLRYKFRNVFPGDEASKKSILEAAQVSTIGYMSGLPFGKYSKKSYIIWDAIRRRQSELE